MFYHGPSPLGGPCSTSSPATLPSKDAVRRNRSRAPSTTHLEDLPGPARLRVLCRALAVLDAILDVDDEGSRYFRYDAAWSRGVEVASLSTGEGDSWFAWFSAGGTVIRGFDLHSRLARENSEELSAQLFAALPKALDAARTEPAFGEATFVIWRLAGARRWSATPLPGDGSRRLLMWLDDEPKTFVAWAKHYYGRSIAPEDVREVYGGKIDGALVARLHPDADVARALALARELGLNVGDRAPPPRSDDAIARAAFAKTLHKVPYPALLAKRLALFALVDAIVAPEARSIVVTTRGSKTSAELAWGGALLRARIEGAGAAFEDSAGQRIARWDRGGWSVERADRSLEPLFACMLPNYSQWAAIHYGRRLDSAAVGALWKMLPLTREIAAALDSKSRWLDVAREARRIGWKVDR